MKLLYNPFKKKKKLEIWTRLRELSNFTWKNRNDINKLLDSVIGLQKVQNEVLLTLEQMNKPKKRGRPRKNG
tara:strand:+ start:140 stop:355 length:216 start_codon:yes stop_codon:yes gene_type:complete